MNEKPKSVKKPRTLGETEGWNGGYDAYDCDGSITEAELAEALSRMPQELKDQMAAQKATVPKTTK